MANVKPNTDPQLTEEGQAKVDKILAAKLKRHEQIWLLHEMLLTNRQVAKLMGTNPGHVGNSIKDYVEHPEKIAKLTEKKDQIFNQ